MSSSNVHPVVTFRGQYSAQDLRDGVALAGRFHRWQRLYLETALAGAATMAVMIAVSWSHTATGAPLLATGALTAMLVPGARAGLRARAQAQAMARAMTTPFARHPLDGTATAEHLEMNGPLCRLQTRWANYVNHVVDDHGVLLYPSWDECTFIPRRFFASDTDWEAFQALIRAAAIPSRPVPPPRDR